MPKIGSRSYSLYINNKENGRTLVVEPATEIQFDITVAMYTKASIGYIRIYNPDDTLKNFILYKYPVGDKRNKLFIELRPILLATTKVAKENIDSETFEEYGSSISSPFLNTYSYYYCMDVKAYVYQTLLLKPNPKEEYIQLQLMSGLYDLFSETVSTNAGATYQSTLTKLQSQFSKLGYPFNRSINTNGLYSSKKTLMSMLNDILASDSKQSIAYLENLTMKIADADFKSGKGSRGRIGSYNNPFLVDVDSGLMDYPKQINNDVIFKFNLSRQFPLDSYVEIPDELINRPLVTPSLSGGAGSLNWLKGDADKYRVMSYRLVGDYFNPGLWYQEVVAQSGNMPLAANLQNYASIGVF